eukprot:3187971-Pyramimonas_sp.AAC.1
MPLKSADAHPDGLTAGNGRGTGMTRIHGWHNPDSSAKETAAWGLIGIDGSVCTCAGLRREETRTISITRHAGAR